MRRSFFQHSWMLGSLVWMAGCVGLEHQPVLPAPSEVTWTSADSSSIQQVSAPVALESNAAPEKTPTPFRLPAELPGADAPPIQLPVLKDLTPVEREKKVREAFPQLTALPADEPPALPDSGKPYALVDLQQMALERNPSIKRAAAEADAAYGAMIQAGLHPNPTAGWQADQMQPGNKPNNNMGQQGAFIQQLIKTAGKLTLARAAAGMEYANAQIAYRRMQLDVITRVRSGYFAVLVAHETMNVSRTMAELTEEVYRLQLRQVASGEAAAYEPLQLYAQATQARNVWVRSRNLYKAAWKQLAANMGMPDLPMQALTGSADAAIPKYDLDQAQARILENHTDILTAQNAIMQAQYQLRFAKVTPIPDITTGTVIQHDNSNGNNQVNLQIGFTLPVFDRNQGNIRAAYAQLARASEDLRARRNDLSGRLAEVTGRYQSNQAIVENYRLRILPNLSRAYRAIYQRYQQEPEKVGFNDVVVAQQNLGQALASYLTSIGDQWTSVVDLANLLQIDDLNQPLVDAK
ncbi:MAG: TolC family protein [Planctomycetes bacterium]|nr:TolC family protein [Planctomycetota bacterium]